MQNAMNTIVKVLCFIFVATVVSFIFHAVDYKFSTVLKEPIRVAYFTKKRFVVAGDRYLTVMSEINRPSSIKGNTS